MLHHYYGLGKAPWFNDELYEGFDSDSCECLLLDSGGLMFGILGHVDEIPTLPTEEATSMDTRTTHTCMFSSLFARIALTFAVCYHDIMPCFTSRGHRNIRRAVVFR